MISSRKLASEKTRTVDNGYFIVYLSRHFEEGKFKTAFNMNISNYLYLNTVLNKSDLLFLLLSYPLIANGIMFLFKKIKCVQREHSQPNIKYFLTVYGNYGVSRAF